MNQPRLRVLMIASHPVQYAAPVFRRFARDYRLDVQVAYCSMQGSEKALDPEFGVEVAWDIPLMEGYSWTLLPNWSLRPASDRLWGLLNPAVWPLIRKGRFDAVVMYTGYACATSWMAIAAARASGTPILFGTDATGFQPRDRKRWKLPMKRLILPTIFRFADVVMVGSEAGRQFILGMGISESRVVVTPFVVDNAWWEQHAQKVDRSAVRREWNIPNDAVVALFCAKLQPWKRPQDLLRAFAKVRDGRAHLVFAGEGPMRAALESEALSLGVAGRVRFLGFVNQSALPEVYRASDLFVLPSEYEPFGVVVNEAMLCGCCVIASDKVGAALELVRHGETGFVFPSGDVDGLAQILREIFADPARRVRIGEAACARMADWSPKQSIEATVQAIERAVRLRSGVGVECRA